MSTKKSLEYDALSETLMFTLPSELRRIVDLNLCNIDPWSILNTDQIGKLYQDLKVRYPSRNLIPFSRRKDNDDIACFEKETADKVFVIHDYASIGWEQHAIYDNFWLWFRKAIEDMIWFE